MPVTFAYLIGAACITLVGYRFYRDLEPESGWGVALVMSALAGIPLGSLVSLAPIFALCLVFGPVT